MKFDDVNNHHENKDIKNNKKKSEPCKYSGFVKIEDRYEND